jgi:putative hemolysin
MKLSNFFTLHAANAVMFEETHMVNGRGRSKRLQSSQDDAQAYCERQGGNLVFFKTEGEFTTFANEYAKWKPVRVGYTRDNTTDPFRAINGDTDVYTRFNDDETPDRETCLLLAKTQRKKFTNKRMFPANCDNKKMSWCRYEEEQNSVRNGDFWKYKVAEIIANAHDAEAYCESRGGHLPYLMFGKYDDEVNVSETLNANQWTGLKRSADLGRAGSIVDKLNRDRTIDDDFWLTGMVNYILSRFLEK